jgi:hypothetical protein
MRAALGLRSKTGRAVAVAIAAGEDGGSRLLLRREVSLVDPAVPETTEPYHVVMELPWAEALRAVRPYAAAVERAAVVNVAAVVTELARGGARVAAIGVVGAAEKSLERIGNPHIRAHAAEGVLFRHVLTQAAKASGISSVHLVERGLPAAAAASLGWPARRLEATLEALGRMAGPPWRADEKAAATAALVALHGRVRRG